MGFFQKLGDKIVGGMNKIGQKVDQGYKLAVKGINTAGKWVSNKVNEGAKAIGADGIIGWVADEMRMLRDEALKIFPKDELPAIRLIYNLSPARTAIEGGLFAADVASGRRVLDDKALAELFPEYAIVKDFIETGINISKSSKQNLGKLLKDEARKLAISVARTVAKRALSYVHRKKNKQNHNHFFSLSKCKPSKKETTCSFAQDSVGAKLHSKYYHSVKTKRSWRDENDSLTPNV